MTPLAASANAFMNRRNDFSKPSGSSMRNTRLNVSWLGTPCFSVRTLRNKSSFVCANKAMSQQPFAPHNVAKSAMNRISVRSCNAFSARGAGTAEKHSRKRSIIVPLPVRRRLQNPFLLFLQYLAQNHMRFPCPQGGGAKCWLGDGTRLLQHRDLALAESPLPQCLGTRYFR